MQLTFTTVTPTHIGNGEELYDLDYVVHNGWYYRVNQKQFLDFLGKQVNPENDIIAYADWVHEQTERIADIEATMKKASRHERKDHNQTLANLKYSFKLLNFTRRIKKHQEFIKYLKEEQDIVKIPFNQREVKGQIRGQIKTATDYPYVPGSSLKGAVRTALLYHYLTNHAKINDIEHLIRNLLTKAQQTKERRDLNKQKQRFADQIEHKAFYCKMIDDRGRLKSDDEKFDVLKLLSFSDGIIKNSKQSLQLADVKLYLVEKQQNRNKRQSNYVATEQSQTAYVEAIKPETKLITQFNFNIDFLLAWKKKINNKGIKVKNHVYWIGLTTKIKEIFNLDINTLTAENKIEKQEEVHKHILECIKRFSQKQLEQEKIWLEHFDKNDRSKNYSNDIAKGQQVVQKFRNHYLLRLGFGTGFNGITELLYILENDSLKVLYKDVMEVFGIGDKPGAEARRRKEGKNKRYEANIGRFPKSRRLVKDYDLIQSMGWIVVGDQKIKTSVTAKKTAQQENFIKRQLIEKQLLEKQQKIKEEERKRKEEERKETAKQIAITRAAKKAKEQAKAKEQGINLDEIKLSDKRAFDTLKKAVEDFSRRYHTKNDTQLRTEFPDGFLPESTHEAVKTKFNEIFDELGKTKRGMKDRNKWLKKNSPQLKKVTEWVGKEKAEKWFSELTL